MKRLLLTLLLLGLAQPSWAAVTFDNSCGSAQVGTQASTFTFSCTVGTLTNGAMLVYIGRFDAYTNPNGVASVTATCISGALVQVAHTDWSTPIASSHWAYRGLNPSSGSCTVSVVGSGTSDTFSPILFAVTLAGVDQTTPVNSFAILASSNDTGSGCTSGICTSVNGTTGDPITIPANGMAVDFIALYNSGAFTGTAGAGQTDFFGPAQNSGVDNGSSSYSTTNTGMKWTFGGDYYNHIVIALNAAAGGGGGPDTEFMGRRRAQ